MRNIVFICCLLLSGLTELVGIAVLSHSPDAAVEQTVMYKVEHHSTAAEHDCCDDEGDLPDDCCDGSCEKCDNGCGATMALLGSSQSVIPLPQLSSQRLSLRPYPTPIESRHIPPIA